jgi:nitrate/nitrite-specific signal transduction histidine kinase
MAAYLLEPATAPTSTPDYGSSITGIRSELTSIDTDTTAIAASIATMAANSTLIKSSLQTIENSVNTGSTTLVSVLADAASALETIADKQTLMETYQKKLKELAEDKGIRIVSPWEYLTLILQYKSLIEEGNILKEPTIQKSATKEARAKIDDYIRSIGDLPREF